MICPRKSREPAVHQPIALSSPLSRPSQPTVARESSIYLSPSTGFGLTFAPFSILNTSSGHPRSQPQRRGGGERPSPYPRFWSTPGHPSIVFTALAHLHHMPLARGARPSLFAGLSPPSPLPGGFIRISSCPNLPASCEGV